MVALENAENYLLLKQTLCMLAVTRLNKVISIDGCSVEQAAIAKTCTNLFEQIQDEFYIPTITIRSGFSAVNFDFLSEGIDMLINKSDHVVIRNVIEGPVLQKHIYSTPDKPTLFKEFKKEFLERNKLFEARSAITRIMNNVDKATGAIGSYIQSQDGSVSIQYAIACVNAIESADYAFTLSDDGEGVFIDKTNKIEVFEND